MKALGMYIFGGSQTIGWMNAGFEVDKILEMTEDMTENNAYHFTKNYPNIEIVKPSIWNDDIYLKSLKDKYDVLFGNPPCSGLSQINRGASADNATNDHIYEYVDTAMKIQPKVFFIENAPTLTKLGLPILKDIAKTVNDTYRLLIISDSAANHKVAMERRRTFVIGLRRDIFDKIPKINANRQDLFTVADAFKGLTDNVPNMEPNIHGQDPDLVQYYNLITRPKQTIYQAISENFTTLKLDERRTNIIGKFREKSIAKNGGVWDKSAMKLDPKGWAPSMTSLAHFIHPTENRDLYIREYARLMGYPDDFIFYQKDCKCSTVQCLAQGVPVSFIEYIATETKKFLETDRNTYNCDILYINQRSGAQKMVEYALDDFLDTEDISKNKKTQSLF